MKKHLISVVFSTVITLLICYFSLSSNVGTNFKIAGVILSIVIGIICFFMIEKL